MRGPAPRSSRSSCAWRPRAPSATARSSSRPTTSKASRTASIVATGNVTVRQRGAVIHADRVEYSGDDQMAIATGNVTLDRDGRRRHRAAARATTWRTDTGEMDEPVFAFPKTPERRTASRGHAENAILLEPEQQDPPHDARSTPRARCRATTGSSRVSELDSMAHATMGIGVATPTVFFLGVPILYSPCMSFPLDNKRKSGFLAPTFGTSGQSGFEVVAAVLLEHRAQLRTRRSRRSSSPSAACSWAAEFRYLDPKFIGQIDVRVPAQRPHRRPRPLLPRHPAHADACGPGGRPR